VNLPHWPSYIAGVVTGLLIPTVRNIVESALKAGAGAVWEKWLEYPVTVCYRKWTIGRHHCGHRAGSYVTYRDNTRACLKCHEASPRQ
jgi:hypothetical protein